MADLLDGMESGNTVAETEQKKTLDVSRFFTKQNEDEGTWVEPLVFGELVGLEFKVLGANSTKLALVTDEFKRKTAEIEEIKDIEERAKRTEKLYAESAAKRVVGLRAARNLDVTVDGKPVEYSDSMVKHIFEESPAISSFIVRYSADTSNFMTRKDS